MQVGRGHHNTLLLPDGSMVTVGGGVGVQKRRPMGRRPEQRQIELWNPPPELGARPLSGRNARLPLHRAAPARRPRGLSRRRRQRRHRPRHRRDLRTPLPLQGPPPHDQLSAPHVRSSETSFDVDTPDTNITRAALVAPGATTHANDMNQRYIPLAVAQRPGGVTLTAPASAEITTPGYYMLFLLNSQGVPSVAKFMRLGYAWEPAPPPTPPPTTPSGGGGTPDRTGPKLRFRAKTGFDRRRWRLSGSASDPSGVRRVDLALARKQGARCRYWSPRRRDLGKLRSCTRRRVFFRGSLALAGSPRRWSAKLRGPLPPGRYVLTLKGTDRKGNVSMRRGIHLRVKQRHR